MSSVVCAMMGVNSIPIFLRTYELFAHGRSLMPSGLLFHQGIRNGTVVTVQSRP